jgi:NADPH:quinone reductase
MTVATSNPPRPKVKPPSVVPAIMRAAAIEQFGGPEVLRIISVPVPTLDPGEVLIRVHTAGVGGWDADMREGWAPSGRAKFPLILGTDGSGHIADVGSRVRRFHAGDDVYAYSFDNAKGGFYAEYVAVARWAPSGWRVSGLLHAVVPRSK